MPSIFTRIIQGEIPCHKIAETDEYFAMLDIRPLAPGHTLVITKKEIDYIFHVEDDLLAGLMLFAKKVAQAVEASVTCKRIGMEVIGTEVLHTHIHLIPFTEEKQMCMSSPVVKMTNDEMAAMAARIRDNYDRMWGA
jgi:histidine triad (HIT) family protein